MTMTMDNEFTPGFSMNGEGSSKRFEREQIKGLQHYRIAPPFGTNNRRSLFKRYQRHWGFADENGNMRPVACSYTVDRYCPVCQKVKDANIELKRLKGGDDSKKIEDLPLEIQSRAQELSEFVRQFRVENAYMYNAIRLDGKPVVLELKWTAHKGLWGDDKEFDGKIKEAVKKFKMDPTSLRNGVWFTFNKTGSKLNTEYTVDFKKTTTQHNGGLAEVLDQTPLSDDVVAAIEAQLAQAGQNGVAAGPLTDIHTLLAPTTAKQLADLMGGAPVRSQASQVHDAPEGIDGDIDENKLQGAEKYAPKPARQAAPAPIPAPAPAPTAPQPPVAQGPAPMQAAPQPKAHAAKAAVPAPQPADPTPAATGGMSIQDEIARLRALQQRNKKPAAQTAATA